MEITIMNSKGEKLSIEPGEELFINSRFVVSYLTGSELLKSVEMFDRQEKLELDDE